MNYIFIGGTYRGFRVLSSLLDLGYVPSHCFILQEDTHEILRYSSQIKDLAERYNIDFSLKKKLKTQDYDYIKKDTFDFAVVCGWRTMIDTTILPCFKFGLVAAHDSLLPKYRGFAPLNWAIINGEQETGVTLFLVNAGEVDSGDIVSQKKVSIDCNAYAIDIYEKVTQATVDLYVEFFEAYNENSIVTYEQDENRASYTCKRIPEDGKINWNESSNTIFNLIRALAHPYPGAFCVYKGETYHIRRARLGDNNQKNYVGRIPGRVIKISREGIEVFAGSGSITITEWENKSKNIVECPSQTVKSLAATLK